VVSGGRLGRGTVDGVRLALRAPAWLVLAESYDRGWSASCDGRDLGAPREVDGFAMGWRVPAGCRAARFAYGPQRGIAVAYLVSAVAALALLGLVLLRRRPAAAPADPAPLDAAAADMPPPLPWRRALMLGALAGAALAFTFGARFAPLFALAAVLVLRRGVGARALLLIAAALLTVAVPAAYLLWWPEDRGGYSPTYAGDLIAAHWITVAALTALVLALARTLSARGRAGPAPGA
jgi:hypothetical protein